VIYHDETVTADLALSLSLCSITLNLVFQDPLLLACFSVHIFSVSVLIDGVSFSLSLSLHLPQQYVVTAITLAFSFSLSLSNSL
jgi:hypothetical protein